MSDRSCEEWRRLRVDGELRQLRVDWPAAAMPVPWTWVAGQPTAAASHPNALEWLLARMTRCGIAPVRLPEAGGSPTAEEGEAVFAWARSESRASFARGHALVFGRLGCLALQVALARDPAAELRTIVLWSPPPRFSLMPFASRRVLIVAPTTGDPRHVAAAEAQARAAREAPQAQILAFEDLLPDGRALAEVQRGVGQLHPEACAAVLTWLREELPAPWEEPVELPPSPAAIEALKTPRG